MASVITCDEIYELKDCISCKNAYIDEDMFLHCGLNDEKKNDNDVCDDFKP